MNSNSNSLVWENQYTSMTADVSHFRQSPVYTRFHFLGWSICLCIRSHCSISAAPAPGFSYSTADYISATAHSFSPSESPGLNFDFDYWFSYFLFFEKLNSSLGGKWIYEVSIRNCWSLFVDENCAFGNCQFSSCLCFIFVWSCL